MLLCIHDMAPADCSFCSGRGEPVPEVRDRANLGVPFTARYPAPCGWCGDRFSEGERVRADRVNGGYVCEGCWQ